MKFVFIFVLSLFIGTIACSADPEKKIEAPKKEASQKKSAQIKNKQVKQLTAKPKSSPVQEHISGSAKARISGAPSSTHISGQ